MNSRKSKVVRRLEKQLDDKEKGFDMLLAEGIRVYKKGIKAQGFWKRLSFCWGVLWTK